MVSGREVGRSSSSAIFQTGLRKRAQGREVVGRIRIPGYIPTSYRKGIDGNGHAGESAIYGRPRITSRLLAPASQITTCFFIRVAIWAT